MKLVDLHRIEILYVVTRLRSRNRAARLLDLNPRTVAMSLHRIEKAFNQNLFHPQAGNVLRPSRFTEEFVGAIEPHLRALTEVVEDFSKRERYVEPPPEPVVEIPQEPVPPPLPDPNRIPDLPIGQRKA